MSATEAVTAGRRRLRLDDPRHRFALTLIAIAVVAAAVRVVYILAVFPSERISGDGVEFHWLARLLVDGYGYVQPAPLLEPVTDAAGVSALAINPDGARIPTAEKPPLYPLVIALGTLIDPETTTPQRLVSGALGVGTVVLIGLIGRRLVSAPVGLVAAAIAAIYPPLWVLDGSLRSETLYVLLIAAAMLTALVLRERPTWRLAAGLGALIGLAALTRGEALLFGVLALALIAWVARPAPWRSLIAAALAIAIVVTPWLVRNWAEFGRPTAISTNEGGLFYGANCDRAYGGPTIGTWACFPPHPPGETNEAVISERLRGDALDYAGDHADRLPFVVGARVLRAWDLWSFPAGTAEFESRIGDRDVTVQRISAWSLYLLVPFAVAGAWLLRRRRLELAIVLTPVAIVTLVAAISYGTVRFRAIAEISLVVLAAVAVVRGAGAVRARRGERSEPAPADAQAPADAGM